MIFHYLIVKARTRNKVHFTSKEVNTLNVSSGSTIKKPIVVSNDTTNGFSEAWLAEEIRKSEQRVPIATYFSNSSLTHHYLYRCSSVGLFVLIPFATSACSHFFLCKRNFCSSTSFDYRIRKYQTLSLQCTWTLVTCFPQGNGRPQIFSTNFWGIMYPQLLSFLISKLNH